MNNEEALKLNSPQRGDKTARHRTDTGQQAHRGATRQQDTGQTQDRHKSEHTSVCRSASAP